ncbi:hypothetical protein HDF19_15110 [Mucilaginibacter sp. E4BP6]|uniref:hypothetical protein n=1 Tax=Mucilaginibacter sp. E4BP6 TaxID=2723089 RepID=UPI0015C6EEEC|nr:hypothetical protein [Mucilaginibacter sp. E4BP6]NYE65677.1 hypothetical protein [Mucilaginibacter sp. E4BP6]
MDNLYLKLLQEFEATGLSSTKSISKFIERNFKKPKSILPSIWDKENEDAMAFLNDAMNTGHLDIKEYEIGNIGFNFNTKEFRWFDIVDIYARLTISGLEFLEKNKSNRRVITNSNAQTLAILLTVLLTGVTLIVTLNNSNSDAKVDKLQIHIREQTQQLHTLQIQLSEVTNELYLEKEAKKNPPKKP